MHAQLLRCCSRHQPRCVELRLALARRTLVALSTVGVILLLAARCWRSSGRPPGGVTKYIGLRYTHLCRAATRARLVQQRDAAMAEVACSKLFPVFGGGLGGRGDAPRAGMSVSCVRTAIIIAVPQLSVVVTRVSTAESCNCVRIV